MINLKIFTLIFILTANISYAQEVSPWSPYKVISEIINDLHYIRRTSNVDLVIDSAQFNKNKTPDDVYDQSLLLMQKLDILTKKEKYKIEYQISIPQRPEERMIPSDVLKLLNEIKTVTGKIVEKLGDDSQLPEVYPEPGMTPPYVYQKVIKAHMLLDTLL
ncbi:hypothetical protein N9W34_04415 [Rickettsiales bacterium]|nr:hypothetical protein [Rickettsiales bacterium]